MQLENHTPYIYKYFLNFPRDSKDEAFGEHISA